MSIYKKIIVLIFTTILSFGFISQTFHVIARSEATKQSPNAFRNKIASPSARNDVISNSTCTIYKWFSPNTNEKEGKLLLKNCSSCHMAYYNEWKDDKHSMSQNNPFFLEVYKQFKEDHPDKNGNCALCHNPEAALDNNFDVDLRKRNAKKSNGISCDFCHKIESIDQDPFKKGVDGLNILRTCEGMKDVRFGPIKDPIKIERIGEPAKGREDEYKNEGLKYNSLYKTSLVCAKCHDGSNGNVQIYSTFSEWINSPAAKKGVQCQSCHMKPGRDAPVARLSIVDNPNIKQKLRPYHQVHSHSFLTENPHEFRKKYVDLMITVKTPHRGVSTNGNNILIVTATVLNNNFGHSFPTGSPMRNAILIIEAKDKNGKELKLLKGPRLPIYGGNLKNKPGKLFAKILSETSGEYGTKHGRTGMQFRKIANKLGIPAQDWWNVFIASDTRIKANEDDVSVYEFDIEDVIASPPVAGEAIPSDSHNDHVTRSGLLRRDFVPPRNDIQITAKLIWRNTWSGLAKIKGVKLEEDIIVEKRVSL